MLESVKIGEKVGATDHPFKYGIIYGVFLDEKPFLVLWDDGTIRTACKWTEIRKLPSTSSTSSTC